MQWDLETSRDQGRPVETKVIMQAGTQQKTLQVSGPQLADICKVPQDQVDIDTVLTAPPCNVKFNERQVIISVYGNAWTHSHNFITFIAIYFHAFSSHIFTTLIHSATYTLQRLLQFTAVISKLHVPIACCMRGKSYTLCVCLVYTQRQLKCISWFQCVLYTLQWLNLSIEDTSRTQLAVLYREVSYSKIDLYTALYVLGSRQCPHYS